MSRSYLYILLNYGVYLLYCIFWLLAVQVRVKIPTKALRWIVEAQLPIHLINIPHLFWT